MRPQVHLVRPGGPPVGPPGPVARPGPLVPQQPGAPPPQNRGPGVVQHTGMAQQGGPGYGGPVVGPQYGVQRPLVQQQVWRGPQQGSPGPQQPRMVRPVGPPGGHLGSPGPVRGPPQQYPGQQAPPQGKDIAYNVEHVFIDENGREVSWRPDVTC